MAVDASETPSLLEVLDLHADRRLEDLQTAFPAKVVSYDSGEQTVTVEPQLHEVYRGPDGERISEKLPNIPNVPVAFTRGGGYAVTVPIEAGDYVYVICAKYSLDVWRGRGSQTDPGDARRFGLSGAFAVPGLFPNGDALSDAATSNSMVLGEDGGNQVVISSTGINIGSQASTEPLVLGLQYQTAITALTTALSAFLATINPATGVTDGGTATTAAIAAITAFQASLLTQVSLKHKTE